MSTALISLALISLTLLAGMPLAQAQGQGQAQGQDTVLGGFAVGEQATDLSGFRLNRDSGPDATWIVGARLSDRAGGSESSRTMIDFGHQNSGMRLSFGLQFDWQDPASPSGRPAARPFSFGSEQSRQASPYVGFGYVGRISDQFEITLDAGANYIGSDRPDSLGPAVALDNGGDLYGWSPTVLLSGRLRF